MFENNESKSRVVSVYVTPTMLDAIDRAAEQQRRERSQWVRLVIEDALSDCEDLLEQA